MRKAALTLATLLSVVVSAYTQNSLLPSFRSNRSIAELYYSRGSTKGSRYLFDTAWVKGTILFENNDLVNSDSLRFNLDKMSQTIYLTRDFRTIEEISRREIRSVTFYLDDSVYIFEHVNLINGRRLFTPLIKSEKRYSLFKLLRTGVKKIYYGTERSYDAFVDVVQYFIIYPNREVRSFYSLKKSRLERLFFMHQDLDKVHAFFSDHPDDKIDEVSLKNLILYLNQSVASNN